MPSALWFIGGVFVGMLVSCMLFLFVMGAHEDDYYEEDDEEMSESQGGKHILKVNRLDNSRFSSNLDHDDNEDYYSSANAAYFASEKDDRHKKKKSKVNGVIVGLIKTISLVFNNLSSKLFSISLFILSSIFDNLFSI